MRRPPAPPERESGTETWMRQFGVPARVRGSRAMEVSKALTQVLRHTAPRIGLQMGEDGYVLMGDLLRTPRFWNQWIRVMIREEEIVDVIHYNKKSRFQVGVRDGRYLVRAMQGHSIVHVRDELLLTLLSEDEAPEYAAHGTDFYESILKHGLVAGGQQGAACRRHIHMVATLPWEGPISGMRNSCDIVLWIRTRQAVAEGAIRLYRSANDVFLTEDAVGPRFFHSVQVLSTRQVLLSKDEPPHPTLVALAVSQRYMRVSASGFAFATLSDPAVSCLHPRLQTSLLLPCRTIRTGPHHQLGRDLNPTEPHHHKNPQQCKLPNRCRPVKQGRPKQRRRHRFKHPRRLSHPSPVQIACTLSIISVSNGEQPGNSRDYLWARATMPPQSTNYHTPSQ